MHCAPRLRLLLLASLFAGCGFWLCAQAQLPPGALTPQSLTQFCAAVKASSCVVPLSDQNSLALHGDWHVPGSLHLRFSPGSSLHISGGILHFDGAFVDAPTNDVIFPDADRVRGLSAARPEWFVAAAPADQHDSISAPYPMAALASAYQATEPWGTIYLQARSYVSPFSGCSSGPASFRYLSPRTLVGAGRPTPDNLMEPSRLQGGTILLGGVVGTAPVRLAHLGVDVGPQVSARVLHGCEPAGIFIGQPDRQFVSGDRLEDVSVLTTGAPDMHSVMIAGHTGAQIHELWIWTLLGTHGLVLKSSNSTVDGLHCFGALADCLIVKSDYATDMLGRADNDRVAHVEIGPLRPDGYSGGIMVEGRWDSLHSLDMEDIHETSAFGIAVVGSAFYRPHDIVIHRWTVDGVSAFCLLTDRADSLHVSDFRCALRPGAATAILVNGGRGAAFRNGLITCDGDEARCAAGHNDGLFDDAQGTSLQNIRIQGLGGYAVHGPHPASAADTLLIVGMGTRTYLPYPISWGSRLHEAASQSRPLARIAYTTVDTRLLVHPAFACALAFLLTVWIAWFAIRRLRPAPVR